MIMKETFTLDPVQSEKFLGRHFTDKTFYQPFDKVVLTLERENAKSAKIYVYDAGHNLYAGRIAVMTNGRGQVEFEACGEPGTHTVRIFYDDKIQRPCFFRLEVETKIETGNPEFDGIQSYLREISAKCCAEVEVKGKKVSLAGRAGDTTYTIWFRDGGYGLLAYVYWHPYLKEFCDFFLATQDRTGFFRGTKMVTMDNLPSEFGRCYNEPDLEYIAVIVVHRVWQATGDDHWMKKCLPKLERGLKAVMTSRKKITTHTRKDGKVLTLYYRNSWDEKHGMVKRTHTCDTWDFQQNKPGGSPVYVIAACDQSGYFRAMKLLEKMHGALGNEETSRHWCEKAEELRKKANRLLWDGTKYLHHKHIDELDHGSFNESEQLAMGNTWAMNRGVANHPQCVSIINEYKERWDKTGDKWPWWSLQPGYPTGTFNGEKSGFWAKVQGSYANGGLICWVGGELAYAALEHGCENFGVQQLKLYYQLLRNTRGGNNTWYWPDGTPGLSYPNSTDHSIWDIGAWMLALQEGLAGIKDTSKLFEDVSCSPKWSAAQMTRAKVVSTYPGNNNYFSYSYEHSPETGKLKIKFSGTGNNVNFSVLIPKNMEASKVMLDGKGIKYKIKWIEKSAYCEFQAKIRKNISKQSFSYLKERIEENAIPQFPFDLNEITIKLTAVSSQYHSVLPARKKEPAAII